MRAMRPGGEPAQQYRALAMVQLQRIAGLEHCEPGVIARWVESGSLVRCVRGELLQRRDEPCHDVMLVVEGAAVIGRHLGQDDQHVFTYLRPGDLYGLVPLFDGGPHLHDAMAHESSVLLRVPLPVLAEAMRQHPPVQAALATHLAHRNRIAHDRLYDTVRLPLGARLARQLDFLGKYFGIRRPQGLHLSIRMSQADLANSLGASRQQVNAELRKFVERGLVSLARSAVVIRDAKALEASGWSNMPITQARPGSEAAPTKGSDGTDAAGAPTDFNLQGLRVLLVDDDAVVRLLLRTQLQQAGVDVDEADHGKAAVEKIVNAAHPYDLIVMDEHMPVLSGVAATRRIRAHQGSRGEPPTPILGVSSDAGRKDRRRFIAAGMNAHLAKPFGRDEFLQAVKLLLLP
jgi:CheY-like chemotaxis protein